MVIHQMSEKQGSTQHIPYRWERKPQETEHSLSADELKCHKTSAGRELNGGAPETIPIKIRSATKIPAAAIMASLAY